MNENMKIILDKIKEYDKIIIFRHFRKLRSHNVREIRLVRLMRRGGRHSVVFVGCLLCGLIALTLNGL